MTITFSSPVNHDIPVLPNATLVTHEPTRWLLEVQGPLGEIISRLSHLPIADVQLAPFTLDEAILRLLGHVQKDVPYSDARTS
jgi:hypothetical protein